MLLVVGEPFSHPQADSEFIQTYKHPWLYIGERNKPGCPDPGVRELAWGMSNKSQTGGQGRKGYRFLLVDFKGKSFRNKKEKGRKHLEEVEGSLSKRENLKGRPSSKKETGRTNIWQRLMRAKSSLPEWMAQINIQTCCLPLKRSSQQV